MFFLFCFGTEKCVPRNIFYSDFGPNFLLKQPFSFATVPERNVTIFILTVVETTDIRNKTNNVNKHSLNLVELGIFLLELGKKTYYMALGMEQNFCLRPR